jgi:dCMP deaminase
MIISDGYNGTPSGFANDCEDVDGNTQWYVLHAEANAITKLAKSTQNADGSTLYVTLSPCKECSKLIIQSGSKRVIFKEEYRETSGLKILKEAGIGLLRLDYGK